MTKFLTKGISTPIGILIILIYAVVVGGVFLWQLQRMPEELKEEIISPEDETADLSSKALAEEDWKTYQNEEYGFEVKYPPDTQQPHEVTGGLGEMNLFSVGFSYYCNSAKGDPMLYNTLRVEVANNPSRLPLTDWIQRYEYCATDLGSSENITLAGTNGIKLKGAGACPPGAGGIGYKVYLSKDSKIYMIGVYQEPVLASSPEQLEECLEEQENTFNQMLSTFCFLE